VQHLTFLLKITSIQTSNNILHKTTFHILLEDIFDHLPVIVLINNLK